MQTRRRRKPARNTHERVDGRGEVLRSKTIRSMPEWLWLEAKMDAVANRVDLNDWIIAAMKTKLGK